MGCCQTSNGVIYNAFAANEQEILIRPYFSFIDKTLKVIEKDYNILSYIQLIDFINALENYSESTKNVPFGDALKTEYSSNEEFMNEKMSKKFFMNFIEHKIIKNKEVYIMSGMNNLSIKVFLELYNYIYNTLEMQLKEFFKINNNNDNNILFIKKSNILSIGMLYCLCNNISKIKLLFQLFNEKNMFIPSIKLNEFFVSMIIVATNCQIISFQKLQGSAPKIQNIINNANNLNGNNIKGNNLSDIYNKYCDIKNTKKLLDKLNNGFFEFKKALTFEEYTEKFKDFDEGLGWILSSQGIRQMIEELDM